MLPPDEQFPIDTYVRLRDGVDSSLYNGFSRVGNKGWVRKRKLDRYGYPQVFVEWDRLNDWSYNGAEDGWTWQGHFDAVEGNGNEMANAVQPDNQGDPQEQIRAITENFVKAIFGAMGALVAEPPPDDISEQPEVEESEGSDKWDDLASQANAAIAVAPAYLVIALERAEVPGAPSMVIPRVFHAARESEGALIVQSQPAHVLASLQDVTIASVLESERDEA